MSADSDESVHMKWIISLDVWGIFEFDIRRTFICDL